MALRPLSEAEQEAAVDSLESILSGIDTTIDNVAVLLDLLKQVRGAIQVAVTHWRGVVVPAAAAPAPDVGETERDKRTGDA